MTRSHGAVASVPTESTENLEQIAGYVRELLLERHAHADAVLLAEALESIQRRLAPAGAAPSQRRPAA